MTLGLICWLLLLGVLWFGWLMGAWADTERTPVKPRVFHERRRVERITPSPASHAEIEELTNG